MTTRTVPEGDLLAPFNPALKNESDEWPGFELTDVKVFTPDDPSNLTSLLEAAAHYPLTLTGRLEPLAKNQEHLQLQTTPERAPTIEIKDVRMFSYGQFEDGKYGLWAGGKAGWYALQPSRAYKRIWADMLVSVCTFYFVVDSYRDKRRKGRKKTSPLLPDYTAEELFDKHAAKVLNDATAGDLSAQVIYEQRYFLLASMLAGKEGIAWAKNPLYRHLSQQFPDEHDLIKSRLTGHAMPARNERQKSASVEGGNLKRKRGRPGKDYSVDAVSTREHSMVDTGETTSQREASQQHDSKSTASRRTRRGQRESPSMDKSAIEAKTPREVVDSDDEPTNKSMKGRSALRPKATKAGKGASKGGKAPVQDFDEDNDSDDEQLQSPTAIAKKHQSHTFANRNAKRKTSKHDVDEGIDIPSSPASGDPPTTPSETGIGADGNDNSDEEGEDEDQEPGTDLALRLKHEPDPIQEDTWVCALDGCSHKVYQASQADSQRLIREHYALHAYDDDERVQLVKKLQHPSLPVGHLMERVRSQARSDGFPGSTSVALEGAAAHSRYRPLPQVRY